MVKRMKVCIVGGVAGGASAAARLRRLDEQAEIVLLERGAYISFANCGLPYYVGGEIQKQSALTLQTPASFRARFNVDVRVESEVRSIDRDAKTLTVRSAAGETYTERYDKLILSPGAEPVRPPIPGLENKRVFTLRTIPDAVRIREYIEREKPESAVVIGGGYIGVEMAENLRRAGLHVFVVEMSDHLIAPLDSDMACDVHSYARSMGLELVLGNGVKAVAEKENRLTVQLSRGELTADLVILSVGVRPDSALAKAAGLTVNDRGAIVTNRHMMTSDTDIFAVGDAVEITDFVTGNKGFVPLAGPANKQGRIAADNLCGLPSVYKGTQGSSVLKLFDMTVAMTGLNERAARAAGLDYDKVFTYSAEHASYYPGGRNLSMKVLFERGTGRLLGAQLVGFGGVDKRCDVLATAIRAKLTGYDLTELELCYAPPFSSAKDPVNFAGYVIENILTGKVSQFHWHDVEALPRDGSVTLLDVRTEKEYAAGHIDGFVNIPLDSLRDRIGELAPGRTVYVHCHSGLRSYIACRILTGNGFPCKNLAGGYRLYASVLQDRAVADHPCYEK